MSTRTWKPDGIYPGSRCAVEAEGVRALGTFMAGISQGRYVVRLDGTDQAVTVPGSLIQTLKEGEE